MQEASLPERARRRLLLAFATIRPSTGEIAATERDENLHRRTVPARLWNWLAQRDPVFWAILIIGLVAFIIRLYGINWDANNHLHPDERQIVFKAMCLSFPGTPRIAN